jgi:hypothetical protein
VTDDLLDELARSLARPVPRRSALRLLGGALVAAGVSGLLPSRGRAAPADDPCPTCADRPNSTPCCVRLSDVTARVAIGQCYYPGTEQCCTGPSAHDGRPTAWICSKDDTCGADGVQLCIPPPCHWNDPINGAQQQPYNPASECCTSFGVEPKFQGFNVRHCKDTMKSNGSKPKVNGCGTDRIKLRDTFRCGGRKVTVRSLCNDHDRCYGNCRSDKDQCDRTLISAFEKACERRYADGSRCRQNCIDVAYTVSLLLRTHDEPERAYKQAQQEACQCCP